MATRGRRSNVVVAVVAALLVCSFAGWATADCGLEVWMSKIRTNDVAHVRRCLYTGVDVDMRDALGCTGLINAAANSRIEVSKELLSANANVNAQCRSGNAAIHYAAQNGLLELAKILHDAGADVELRGGRHKLTPLELAAEHGKFDVVRFLHSSDVDIAANWTGNELMWAAAHGETKHVLATHKKGADLEFRDQHGNTAFLWAARQGSLNGLRAVVGLGADIHARTHSGWTAMHQAAYNGQVDIIEELLAIGLNVNSEDDIGWSPAMYAAMQGHVNVLSHLHSAGAKFAATSSDWSPLMVAVAANQAPAAKFLLRKGQDWKIRNRFGETCETLAKRNNHDELYNLFHRMRIASEYEAQRLQRGIHRHENLHSEL